MKSDRKNDRFSGRLHGFAYGVGCISSYFRYFKLLELAFDRAVSKYSCVNQRDYRFFDGIAFFSSNNPPIVTHEYLENYVRLTRTICNNQKRGETYPPTPSVEVQSRTIVIQQSCVSIAFLLERGTPIVHIRVRSKYTCTYPSEIILEPPRGLLCKLYRA